MTNHTTTPDSGWGEGTIVHVAAGTSASALQRMIDGAAPETVFKLAAGTFTFDRTIELDRDGVSVIGAGSGKTVIKMKDIGAEAFRVGDGDTAGSVRLAAGAAEGATSLRLAGDLGLKPGDHLYIVRENTAAFFDEIGDTAWRKMDVPLRTSIVEVASVNGDRVELTSGVHFDFTTSGTTVHKIDLVEDVSLGGFTIDYGLGRANPSDFENRASSYYRNAVIEVEGTDGLQIRDIVSHDVPSLGLNVALSREADVRETEFTGAHNKGAGGNGYALQIRDVYDSSFTGLNDQDMRHSVVFASWRSAAGNHVQVDQTDRDINFHGGRDHDNTVVVTSSIRDAASDIISPTLFVNTMGTSYGADTEAGANSVWFGTVSGTRLGDNVRGLDSGSWLDGAGGHDTLTGGSGNDMLIGGEGRDVLIGGAGTDVAGYTGRLSEAKIVNLGGGRWEVSSSADNQSRDTLSGVEWLAFEDKAVRLSDMKVMALSDLPKVGPSAVASATQTVTQTETVTLTGTDGADEHLVESSGTVVLGSAGWDTVLSRVSFVLGDDLEKLQLTGKSAINGTGNADRNVLIGNDAANLLRGLGGNDSLYGRAGDDKLVGDTGSDRLFGGLGDDHLFGGAGRDYLDGGGGADRFFFRTVADSPAGGGDVIVDYGDGADIIDLSAIDANTGRSGDQAFDVDAQGAGRLWVSNGILRGDVDGDGRADLEVTVNATLPDLDIIF